MAESPSHKFGQIIGDLLEQAVEPLLRDFTEKYGLFLDKKGYRPARPSLKLTWTDGHGNKHDLDFVIERGGSEEKIGTPAAFIETAWRRYTKHSRNKAQEIQGAIMPLLEKYSGSAPFIGVVLAGVFTKGAIGQLKSLGFNVLYFPYESIVYGFEMVGIDAAFDEETSEEEFRRKVRAYEGLDDRKKARVISAVLHSNREQVDSFMAALLVTIGRSIKEIRVATLHGIRKQLSSIKEAIRYIDGYKEAKSNYPFIKFEIQIVYTNGDTINGVFADKSAAKEFLEIYKTKI